MRSERGQTTIEWTGLVLVLALGLGALAAVFPSVNGRSFGGFLAHRISCAIKGGCDDGDAQLARAYGKKEAERVRDLAPDIVYEPGEPSIPVDYRECRRRACSETPNDRDLDAHRTTAGRRATVFTHVVKRGGRTYIQYWLYYPDSNSTVLASDKLWNTSALLRATGRYPGYHRDDWESYQVRVERNGRHVRPRVLSPRLQGLQALHEPLDPVDGVDPGLARQPRRPHPAERKPAQVAGSQPPRAHEHR